MPTTIGNAQINFKQSVKKLCKKLVCHLTMNRHIFTTAQTCYFKLNHLVSIHRFQTNAATTTLVSAFALSRIDYWNSLPFGSTHDVTSHLQVKHNYPPQVILFIAKSANVTTHLKSHHNSIQSIYFLLLYILMYNHALTCTTKIKFLCLCYPLFIYWLFNSPLIYL